MPIDPLQLLRRLEPPVRPAGRGPGVAARPSLADADFGTLLALAADGTMRSERPVELAPSLAAGAPLSEREIAALGVAADRAEAEGAQRAVVLLGPRALVLDVTARRAERELTEPGEAASAAAPGEEETSVERVDAVVAVHGLPAPEGAGDAGEGTGERTPRTVGRIAPPSAGVLTPGLARALATSDGNDDGPVRAGTRAAGQSRAG